MRGRGTVTEAYHRLQDLRAGIRRQGRGRPGSAGEDPGRVQLAAEASYSEIRDNLIGADCLPIDMLRCKLAFFGASKFDPRSDRWTRITLFQGAPLSGDPAGETSDNSWLPVLP